MSRFAPAVVLAAFLWPAAIFAQATQPSTQPADSVSSLIAQLDDPDFGVREFAEAKLEQMGAAIEPELKAAIGPNISDEARARISHLIREFDEARAMHASITMHYTDAPAMKVLTDFAAQAGAPLGIDDPSVAASVQGHNISVNLDNMGFWESLRAIDDATGLTPSVGQSGITFAGVPGGVMAQIDMSKSYVHSSGGILIEPVASRFTRDRNLTGNLSSTGSITLQVSVIPEPRLHVIGMMMGNWVKQCVDDKGNVLAVEGFNRRLFLPRMVPMRGPRLWQFPLMANFHEFQGIGTRIAKLTGELNLSIETRGITTQIPDITRAANTSKDDGQLSVTVLACTRVNMSYQLDLLIRGAAINDPIYQEFISTIDLLDEKGQSIIRQTFVPRPLPDGIRLTLGFQPTQSTPTTLQWERTLEQKRLTVPFEIDDLPPW